MKELLINNTKYYIKKNVKDALDNADLEEKLTDYYKDYDFIVGDWAYGKLRLKGFNNKKNPNYKKINDVAKVDDYIDNYCAYGCRWFMLEKINNSLEK